MAGAKRSFHSPVVDTEDRLEVGQMAKRQKLNTEHSKSMLKTQMGGVVVYAMEQFAE